MQRELFEEHGLADIAEKVMAGERLSPGDGLRLYHTEALNLVGWLANTVRERLHGARTYFVRNQHVNYTNVCDRKCRFCAFHAREGGPAPYVLSVEEVRERIHQAREQPVSEVHVVGGIDPDLPYEYYLDLLRAIHEERPGVHVKAFTMIELQQIRKAAGKPLDTVLEELKSAGLGSMPGGGAEVLSDRLHAELFERKLSPAEWLATSRAVHLAGLHSNATLLYGHTESPEECVHHLAQVRDLQDETGGFLAFVPLSFHPEGSQLASLPGPTGCDDLRTIAVSRLMLDNVPHIKAFWVMAGPPVAQAALWYGADDVEGTVLRYEITREDATSTRRELTQEQLIALIREAGREPFERAGGCYLSAGASVRGNEGNGEMEEMAAGSRAGSAAEAPPPPEGGNAGDEEMEEMAAGSRAGSAAEAPPPPDRAGADDQPRPADAAPSRERPISSFPPFPAGLISSISSFPSLPPAPGSSFPDVAARVAAGDRLTAEDGVALLGHANLPELGALAMQARHRLSPGRDVTYVVGRNINYTNVCWVRCGFCTFYRRAGDAEGFVLPLEAIHRKIEELVALGGTEVLLQGGLNPALKIDWYEGLLRDLKERYPVHLHVLSPPEILHVARVSRLSVEETLARLREAGLDSLPGGGAELLVDAVRKRVSPRKPLSEEWLGVMRAAHRLGIPTTATMVYGFGESPEERVEHLLKIRALQDETGGFTSFTAWSFQPEGSALGGAKASGYDYLRTIAVARLMLDNVAHIQASWLTQGPKIGQIALHYGVDDFGSTVLEENVISDPGARFLIPVEELERLIRAAGYQPRRRNTRYEILPPCV